MKILMTYHGLMAPNTGACGAMLRVGNGMKALGADVEYWTYSDLPRRGSTPSNHARHPFSVAKRLGKGQEFDILDASTYDNWVEVLKPKGWRTPSVIRSSGLEHIGLGPRRKQGESWRFTLYWRWINSAAITLGIRRSEHFFALNEVEARYVRDKMGMPPEKVTVTPHVLSPWFRAEPPVVPKAKEFRMLWVGMWTDRKGRAEVIPALYQVLQQRSDFRVTVVGAGVPSETILQQLPEPLREKFDFVESVANADLPGIYAAHDVMLFPSHFEGFANVVAEAMHCGCPPISTPEGCALALVQDGVTGFSIDKGSPESLSCKILEAMNRREDLASMGRLCRERALNYCSEESYRVRWRVYEGIVKKRMGRHA